ncbi:MAG: hypothetical protein V4714_13715 [Bacteroidota bacterium]
MKTVFVLFCILFSGALQAQPAQQKFDKSAFYKALASDDIDQITAQIDLLEKHASPEKTAYEGALLMRKAGLVKNVSNKLSLFKSGRLKLEKAISEDTTNTEFRFLRLLIQENAPAILHYRSDLKTDSQHIKASFKSLPTVVQRVISAYSKKSKVLHSADY